MNYFSVNGRTKEENGKRDKPFYKEEFTLKRRKDQRAEEVFVEKRVTQLEISGKFDTGEKFRVRPLNSNGEESDGTENIRANRYILDIEGKEQCFSKSVGFTDFDYAESDFIKMWLLRYEPVERDMKEKFIHKSVR